MSPIIEKVLNTFLDLLKYSFDIDNLKIEIHHKDEIVLSVTATGRQIEDTNIDIERFVIDLPHMRTELVINVTDVIKTICIVDNLITNHKISKRCTILKQIDTVSMKFTAKCDIDAINSEIFKFKNTNPHLKSVSICDLESSNPMVDKNNTHTNKSCQEYKKYCQYVSGSIASTISYSINHNFRKKCLEVVNGGSNQFMSVQEVIQEKLENIEKQHSFNTV